MKNYLNEFNGYMTVVKKATANTAQSYYRDALLFCEYAVSQGVDDTATVDCDFLNRYLAALKAQGKSSSTISRHLSSLKAYYRFLNSLSLCSALPTDGVEIPKKNYKQLPVVLEQSEILKLLAQPDINDYKGIRDKAMLEVMYATGIKASELICLKLSDVDLQIGIINLNSKNAAKRTVPLYDDAVHTLSLYIHHVRTVVASDKSDERLFTNMSGTPLTRQGLWKILKHYAAAAGIEKDITPNTLRHSFAAHMLENGADISDIAKLLGLSDVNSAKIYSAILKNKYTAAYRRFHPLASKK